MSIGNQFSQLVTAIKTKLSSNKQLADSLRGPDGYLMYTTNDPSAPLTSRPVLNKNPIIVDTDTEAQQHLGGEESFETVFNTWKRISHLGPGPYPSVQSELDTWELDETTNRIICTVNTTSLVGFISPDRHDNYVFETIVRSTSTDDDQIGLCLAFTEVDGSEHTLVAMRRTNGLQNIPSESATGIPGGHLPHYLDVYYDIFTPDQRDLGSTNEDITINTGGWAAFPEGCRIRVTRDGDTFTVETSNLGESNYINAAKVTFTLDDYPELSKFKGPQRYGYVCYSQPNSSWETLAKPAKLNEVIVLGSANSYQWNGSEFISGISTDELLANIPNGLLFFNETTRKLYYKDNDGSMSRVRGTS